MTIIKSTFLVFLAGEGGISISSNFSLHLEERRWKYQRKLVATSEVGTNISCLLLSRRLLFDGFATVLSAVW